LWLVEACEKIALFQHRHHLPIKQKIERLFQRKFDATLLYHR
jgi:hypothetical protein